MKRITALMIIIVIFLSGCKNGSTGSTKLTAVFSTSELKTSQTDTTFSEISSTTVSSASLPEYADYKSIIDEYRLFAGYAIEFGAEKYYSKLDDMGLWGWMSFLILVHQSYSNEKPYTKDYFSYAIKDLNGNGSPELILLMNDYVVAAIFSVVEGKPKLLDEFGDRHRCQIDATGLLYTYFSNSGFFAEYKTQQISQDDSSFLLVNEFGDHGDANGNNFYKIVDGKKLSISAEEFDELYKIFPTHDVPGTSDVTKNSGLEFIPLFEN